MGTGVVVPVIAQLAAKLPSEVGVKRTFSVVELPAGTVEPSSRDVSAAKGAVSGGFDFMIVTGVPSELVIVKLPSLLPPGATLPKSSPAGEISR